MVAHHKTYGFTLIELLVVIAIISILTAILFPVFAKVREKARATACLNNEKQISVGIMQYTEDNDESFPIPDYDNGRGPNQSLFASKGSTAATGDAIWADYIQPYVKNTSIFLCPDDTSGRPYYQSPSPQAGTPIMDGALFSYALNYFFYYRPTTGFVKINGITLPEIQEPSNRVYIIEYLSGGTAPSYAGQELCRPADRGQGLNRHINGANYLYADGHCKFHVSPAWWTTTSNSLWTNQIKGAAPSLSSSDYPVPGQWFPLDDTTPEVW